MLGFSLSFTIKWDSFTSSISEGSDSITDHHRRWRRQTSEWREHMLWSWVAWCVPRRGQETQASHMTWSTNACREQRSVGFLRYFQWRHSTRCCTGWCHLVPPHSAGHWSCFRSHLDKPFTTTEEYLYSKINALASTYTPFNVTKSQSQGTSSTQLSTHQVRTIPGFIFTNGTHVMTCRWVNQWIYLHICQWLYSAWNEPDCFSAVL